MNKIVLMICLCVSLQGCSSFGGGSASEFPSVLGGKAEEKEKSPLLGITQFMSVMSLLKTQVE
ncbi:hypothetical protein [Moritella sp. 28]|uniref:hypothetical protein n=1 Tax=Moritella sp. 28 TaxID=2746232 RepID=UPI001BA92701|nr:hypothetical protein [Moritella sp. 28]QUM83672.1 hypothetical protein HWV02_03615 [Moritella sp. 28]